jgi:hypothetical protein
MGLNHYVNGLLALLQEVLHNFFILATKVWLTQRLCLLQPRGKSPLSMSYTLLTLECVCCTSGTELEWEST